LTACSKVGGAEVNDGRKRMATACFDRVEVDSLRKRTVMARSEAGVEVTACSKPGDDVAVCSGSRIEDGRRR
jgi:hypothetical protein